MEATEFDGRWVRIEKTTFERLVAAADNHHARRARFADTDFPEQVISDWLTDLEAARTRPTPAAEPGDLLVKLARAEFWMFTEAGWRELAPIELVEHHVPEDAGLLGEHGAAHNAAGPDFLVGPSEAVRAGWQERDEDEPAKTRRFFGRSVVEDELDRLRAGVEDRVERAEEVQREMDATIDDYHRQRADAELEGGVVLALADWLSRRNDLNGNDVS